MIFTKVGRKADLKTRPPRNGRITFAFFFGLTCFSGLVSRFQLDVMGLPFLFFEPIVILFWLWAAKPEAIKDFVFVSKLKVTTIVFVYAIFLYLALLGATEGDLRDVFSSARAYFLAVLILFFGRILGNVSDRELFLFFLGIVIGDFFSTALSRSNFSQDVIASPVNLVALYVFTSLAVQSQKISLVMLAIVIATILTFLSAFRIVALTAILSLAATSFIIVTQKGGLRKTLRLFLVFSPAPFVLGLLVNWYINNGAELVGHKAFYRIYYRLGAYVDGSGIDAAQDTGRFSQLWRFLSEDGLPLFPQGFVMTGRNMLGHFNDAPFLYFTYTFGLFFGIIILFLMIFFSLRVLFKSIGRSLSTCETVAVALVPYFLIVLLFLNGRYMYIPYETVLFWSFVTFWLPRIRYKGLRRNSGFDAVSRTHSASTVRRGC